MPFVSSRRCGTRRRYGSRRSLIGRKKKYKVEQDITQELKGVWYGREMNVNIFIGNGGDNYSLVMEEMTIIMMMMKTRTIAMVGVEKY